jgi:hypothetical protein
MKNQKEFIAFSWVQKERANTSRIQSMYCFHNCDVNRY